MSRKKSTALAELANEKNLAFELEDFYRQTKQQKRFQIDSDGNSLKLIGKRNPVFIKNLSDLLLGKIKPGGKTPISYEHSPLIVYTVPKTNSDDHRVVCVPTITDRLIQRAVLGTLRSREFNCDTKISYGARGEKSVKKALEKAVATRNELPWVYKTDICFFDNINRQKMKMIVRSKIRLPSLHDLIFQAIDADFSNNLSGETRRIISKQGIQRGRGLRQGLPLSPLLSNLYLHDFDSKIHSAGFNAIRYVDDLAFFCRSREECLEAHNLCKELLKPLGLRVPEPEPGSKTQMYEPVLTAEFLGLDLVWDGRSYQHMISEEKIRKVHTKFNEMTNISNLVPSGINFAKLSNKLESNLSSYKAHYCDAVNYDYFEEKIEKWIAEVYKKIIEKTFKTNLATLSVQERIFFNVATKKDKQSPSYKKHIGKPPKKTKKG